MRLVLHFIAFVLVYAASHVAAFAGQNFPQRRRETTLPLGMQEQLNAEGEDSHQPDRRGFLAPRRGFLTATVATAVAATLAGIPSIGWADDAASTEPLHKLDYPVPGKCGQADGVPENAVFFVKNLGGFKDGSCATEGFTVQEGTAQGTGDKDKQRTYSIYSK
eukprot:scaffold13351_cov200-Amphora_coffeaeformis.AAC.11